MHFMLCTLDFTISTFKKKWRSKMKYCLIIFKWTVPVSKLFLSVLDVQCNESHYQTVGLHVWSKLLKSFLQDMKNLSCWAKAILKTFLKILTLTVYKNGQIDTYSSFRSKAQRVVTNAERIVRSPPPSLQDIYHDWACTLLGTVLNRTQEQTGTKVVSCR